MLVMETLANKKIFLNSFLSHMMVIVLPMTVSDDNTSNSENEVEEHGFYEYSGMEAMMETGIHIILFIRFVS